MKSHSPAKSSTVLVLVLWIAGLGAAMQFAKISVMFPYIKEQYSSAGSEIGLLVSVIGFLGIALGLFTGLIVARIGFRRLLLSALILGALMSFYQATLPPFTMMLFSRIIEGASHLIIVVAAPTLIAQISSNRYRGLAMTLWSTFFGVAFALVAWFGIALVEAFGLESIFIVHAVMLFVTASILAVLLPAQRTIEDNNINLGLIDIAREHIRIYRSPHIAAPAIGWLFYTLTFVAMLTVLPDLVPAEDRSFVAGTMPIASIIVSLACGAFLLPRLSAINTIILGFALAVGILQLLWLEVDKAWVCIALFGVLGLVQSASFAAIPQLNQDTEAQARANGAIAQMGNLGNTIGTPLLLSLLATFGLNGMIWGATFCYLTAIAAHFAMKQRRRVTTAN
ncbi:MAG: MFS transporter [Hyphomicrobiales bacterium]|nr:MAG: MFS transporter [Hyphomicrobiales bacterium]